MAAFLRGAEVLNNLLEFSARQHNLSHVKADAELCVSDEAGSQLVKIAEELGNTGAVLLAEETDAGEHIIHIIGLQLNDLSLNLARLSAGVVIEGLAMGATNTKDTLVSINFIAEVNIVDFVRIPLVHVTSENKVKDSLGGKDTELVEDSEELTLCHVSTLGDIEVLELRLQMDAAVKDSCSVFMEVVLNLLLLR
jgi:hypothetical protein